MVLTAEEVSTRARSLNQYFVHLFPTQATELLYKADWSGVLSALNQSPDKICKAVIRKYKAYEAFTVADH